MQQHSVQKLGLLDHHVRCGEQCRGYGEVKHPSGLVIDDQLKLGRLHDRQVCGSRALEDTTGIDADELVYVVNACPVTDQAADLGKFAPEIDGG